MVNRAFVISLECFDFAKTKRADMCYPTVYLTTGGKGIDGRDLEYYINTVIELLSDYDNSSELTGFRLTFTDKLEISS